MASTKEEIQAAALKAFRTVEVEINGATATLRELSHDERKALDASNFQTKDGELVTRIDPKDSEAYFVPVEEKPSRHAERWIAATITTPFTVDEIAKWPTSLKARICDQAKKVNGIEPASTTAKN